MNTYRFPDYEVAGDADTTVFLLHGAYGSRAYFRPLIDTLVRAGYRVVAWDAPGYGLSPLPQGGLSIEGLAEAAARLIEREGSRRNVVVGHSMGGIVAPLASLLSLGRVHGVVISATVATFSRKSAQDKATFAEERIGPIRRGLPFKEAALPVIRGMLAPTSSGPLVDLVVDVASGMRAETFCAAIEAIVGYDGEDNLKAVSVPTLLIAGAQDKVGRPEGMQSLTALIPDSRFVCIDGAAHYAFAEQAPAFNAALLGFLSELPALRA
ncbi:alpha/beta fold hydrolase [Hydrogenophaga sp. UC242_50]|uniref:alpha/beta fold hydrolase n=1 Tax=unclassified Hydrogenophaga TaxID=2610897 RepID=UPI0036D3AE2B